MINTTAPHSIPVSALAAFTRATAEYESAWRAACAVPAVHYVPGAGHVTTDAKRAADEAMHAAYKRQAEAKGVLVMQMGADAANAVIGAIIMAAAQTLGERDPKHVNHTSVESTRKFIQDCIAGEAGV